VSHKGEDSDSGQYWFGKGKEDPDVGIEISTTIDLSRVIQFQGDRHKILTQEENPEGISEVGREDKWYIGIDPIQVFIN